MSLRLSRTFEAVKEINRRAGPSVALMLLVAAVMLGHLIAMAQVGLLGDMTGQQPRAAARAQFVEYVNGHPLILLPYLTAFASGLFWIQFRKLPRWSFWLTLVVLALPLLGYIWICFRISTGGFVLICR